eukprot:6177563-Pleurochrysis_carterae.AAC.3
MLGVRESCQLKLCATLVTGRIWGGIMHNYVARQELYLPNKAEALAYLAGTGPAPARYAEVHIALGALETPRFVEYKVRLASLNACGCLKAIRHSLRPG